MLIHKADAEYLLRTLLLNDMDYRHFLAAHGLPLNGEHPTPPPLRVLRDYYLPVVPDRYIAHGEQLTFGECSLQVMWTPGHTPGHIVLYWHDAKLLISGDHLLPHITPHVGIHTGLEGDPLSDYLESLKQLEHLQVDQVLPAHGPCFSDHRARIAETIKHHEERQQAILNVLCDGPATAFELACSLFDQTLPDLHKEIAAYEVLAHLELMKKRGQVRAHKEHGVIKFSV